MCDVMGFVSLFNLGVIWNDVMDGYKEALAVFAFFMGLVGFGRFVLIMQNLAKATPLALTSLEQSIAKLTDDKSLHDIKHLLDSVAKKVHDLKYQHDHPDKFGIGTGETNKMLKEISDKLVYIQAKLDTQE